MPNRSLFLSQRRKTVRARFWIVLGLALWLLSACAPNPSPSASTAPPAAQNTAPAGATAAGAPTATASAPKKGGTLTMAVWQEPEQLNWALGSQTVLGEVDIF